VVEALFEGKIDPRDLIPDPKILGKVKALYDRRILDRCR